MASFSTTLTDRPGLDGVRRRQVVEIMQAALEAVDPSAAVRRFVRREGTRLFVAERVL